MVDPLLKEVSPGTGAHLHYTVPGFKIPPPLTGYIFERLRGKMVNLLG